MDTLIVKTDVITVKFYNDLILAGIGNFLHVYKRDNCTLLFKKKVFEAQKVHGINCKTNEIIIFGGKELCIVKLEAQNGLTQATVLNHAIYDDWLLDSVFDENTNEIITISAHNVATGLNLNSCKKWEKSCKINSILYGASIVIRNNTEIFILSGTVFSEIIIWSPQLSNDVLFRLTGHKGVIFSIYWNEMKNLICSTSDDRSVRLWNVNLDKDTRNIISIDPSQILYGHTARVMRAIILDKYVVSSGEDSIINVWDYNGRILKKIEAHQNDCIWSIDCDENSNEILSGGGDSGISLHPLTDTVTENLIAFPNSDQRDNFKKVAFIDKSNIVCVTELGSLLHYNSIVGMTIIDNHNNLKNISMSVSLDNKNVAIAGFTPNIYIYYIKSNALIQEKIITINAQMILALHWVDISLIIACCEEGKLIMVNINTDEYEIFGILPKSKERWSTTACLYKNFIFIGDRVGNLHLYNSNELCNTMANFHGRLGIGFLKIHKDILISTGRDGTIKKFKSLNDKKSLELISIQKLPFKWCANILIEHDIAIGFFEYNLVLWNIKLNRKVFEYNCGGGHRSWDICTLDKDKYKFIFIKDKFIHELIFSITNFKDVEQGLHSHEINIILPIFTDTNHIICISGGEDTLLKINKYMCSSDCHVTKFRTLSSHNFHLSSIRCINSHRIITDDKNLQKFLIFSGGGRAQLVISKLIYDIKSSHYEFSSLSSHTLKLDTELSNENDKNNTKIIPETRLMDIALYSVNNIDIILFVACSDGFIRIYRYEYLNNKLHKICTSDFQNCCILKLSLLNMNENLFLLSMSTNGYIKFWDCSKLIKDYRLVNNKLNSFYQLKIHQSGINSFTSKKYDGNTFLLITGGDDCSICGNLVEINKLNKDIKILYSWKTSEFHQSQVTGLILVNDFLFSCSTDQRVTLFKIINESNVVNFNFIVQYCSTVPDLLGISNFSLDNSKDITFCIYGKGMEIVKYSE